MALTLQRTSQTLITYDNVSKGGIDNVVTALSTEYTQTGFRYIVNISVTDFYSNPITTDLFVHPNPFGRGIINLRPHLINSLFYRGIIDSTLNFPYIHNTKANSPSASLISASGNMNTQVRLEVYEGWEVAGVFTQDPDGIGPQQIELRAFWGWDNAFSFNENNSASSPGKGFNDLTSSTYY